MKGIVGLLASIVLAMLSWGVYGPVLRRGQLVHLTPIEYRLLALMIGNAGKVLTHRYLLREVWGPSYIESNHYVRIYVAHLRQKLEVDPAQPRHFLTETGVGYRFQA